MQHGNNWLHRIFNIRPRSLYMCTVYIRISVRVGMLCDFVSSVYRPYAYLYSVLINADIMTQTSRRVKSLKLGLDFRPLKSPLNRPRSFRTRTEYHIRNLTRCSAIAERPRCRVRYSFGQINHGSSNLWYTYLDVYVALRAGGGCFAIMSQNEV